MCCYVYLYMHGKTTVVRTYYECNVLLCVCMRGKTTVVCTMSGMCMYDKSIVERTMSAMCCYIVYVCMVRQQWYVL